MILVKVFGPGCNNCLTTKQRIEEVAEENGIAIEIEKVEDMPSIMAAGIMKTPGVTIDGKVAHVGGIPDKKTILSWFSSQCCPQDNDCC